MALSVISRGHVAPEHELHYYKHMCAPDQPSFTPDRVEPDVVFVRDLAVDIDVRMPDGNSVKFWTIADEKGTKGFPGVPIRIREGQIAHTITNGKKHRHTLHHHGIEPTPMNDGVGHCSFEIGSDYAYQWQPMNAGTFFYHCHVNTVLHFEYGLYGLLIVDPPEGPGLLFRGGPRYAKEYFWVVDDVDPVWHTFSHNMFMAGCTPDGPFTTDGVLHFFNPQYFALTGVFSDGTAPITDPSIAIQTKVGQPALIRSLNAGYSIARITLGVDATVWAMDGKPLGGGPLGDGTYSHGHSKYSRPFVVPAGTPYELTTAQRWDVLLDASRPGVYPATVEYRHWVTGKVVKKLTTTITVTA